METPIRVTDAPIHAQLRADIPVKSGVLLTAPDVVTALQAAKNSAMMATTPAGMDARVHA
jgi:hypothetical protein